MDEELIPQKPEEGLAQDLKKMREEVLRWLEEQEKKIAPQVKSPLQKFRRSKPVVLPMAKSEPINPALPIKKLEIKPEAPVKKNTQPLKLKKDWFFKFRRILTPEKTPPRVPFLPKKYIPRSSVVAARSRLRPHHTWHSLSLVSTGVIGLIVIMGGILFLRSERAIELLSGVLPIRAVSVDGHVTTLNKMRHGEKIIDALRDEYPSDLLWYWTDDTTEHNFIRLKVLEVRAESSGITQPREGFVVTKEFHQKLASLGVSDQDAVDYYLRPIYFSRQLLEMLQAGSLDWKSAKTQAELVRKGWEQKTIIFEKIVNDNPKIHIYEETFVPRTNFTQKFPVFTELPEKTLSPVVSTLNGFLIAEILDRLPELDLISYRVVQIDSGTDFRSIFSMWTQDSQIKIFHK